jgi:hypothetical protein
MNAREQGHQAARSLTTVLALSGFAFAGGMGVALYTDIESAKAATVQVAGDDGSSAPSSAAPASRSQDDDSAPAQQTAPSSPSSSPPSSSSPSGVSAGSGPTQTSSSGS